MEKTSVYDGERQAAAISTDSLEKRLRINSAYASADFNAWLLGHLNVRPGQAVLDVGCGNGAQTLPFSRLVGQTGSVSALDIAATSVEALKRRLESGARVEVECADMADLAQVIDQRFSVKRYDLAHSSYALYYSTHRLQVLETMLGALRPGGRCAVFTPDEPHGLVEFAARFHPIPEAIRECLRFGPEVLAPWFHAHCADVHVYRFHNELSLPDADTLMAFYAATTYYEAGYADAIRAAAEESVAQHGSFDYEKNGYLIIGRAPGG